MLLETLPKLTEAAADLIAQLRQLPRGVESGDTPLLSQRIQHTTQKAVRLRAALTAMQPFLTTERERSWCAEQIRLLVLLEHELAETATGHRTAGN